MKDTFAAFTEEVKALVGTKAFWFLLGLSMSGQTVPAIMDSVKAFLGI